MSDRQVPIFSAREASPEVREALDLFIVSLAERVDLLQDAESQADLQQLRLLSGELAQEAEELGFEGLASAARTVTDACLEEKADVAQDALLEVTEIARRIRLGHRGAL